MCWEKQCDWFSVNSKDEAAGESNKLLVILALVRVSSLYLFSLSQTVKDTYFWREIK